VKNPPADPYALAAKDSSSFGVSPDDYLDARNSVQVASPFEAPTPHPWSGIEVRGDIRYDKPRGEVMVNRHLIFVQEALVRACPEKYEMKDGRIAALNLGMPKP
jgi:hypothetical protein